MDKIKRLKDNSRSSESRRKFFSGLYAEYTGIVVKGHEYIDSNEFNEILNNVNNSFDDYVDIEQQFYLDGKLFLEENKSNLDMISSSKEALGNNWKSVRFQNLVRLGADIENAGLSSAPRATLVGALLYQKEKQ